VTPKPTPEVTPSLADKPPEVKPGETPLSDSLADKPPEVTPPPEPIVYEDFKVPEGYELDAAALPAVKTLFNELGLKQDQAQRLIDAFVENTKNISTTIENDAKQEWLTLRADWTKSINEDPEIGGAKLPETRANLSKLFDKYGTPGLRDALKLTGADNNPDIVKTFAKIASVLTEGRFLAGETPRAQPKTAAEKMYPQGPSIAMQGKA
jgi:hypothetical protein